MVCHAVLRAQRAKFIAPAKAAGYAVAGYFLQSRRAEAMERNARHATNVSNVQAYEAARSVLLGAAAILQT